MEFFLGSLRYNTYKFFLTKGYTEEDFKKRDLTNIMIEYILDHSDEYTYDILEKDHKHKLTFILEDMMSVEEYKMIYGVDSELLPNLEIHEKMYYLLMAKGVKMNKVVKEDPKHALNNGIRKYLESVGVDHEGVEKSELMIKFSQALSDKEAHYLSCSCNKYFNQYLEDKSDYLDEIGRKLKEWNGKESFPMNSIPEISDDDIISVTI